MGFNSGLKGLTQKTGENYIMKEFIILLFTPY
jgi:hypothetical protein